MDIFADTDRPKKFFRFMTVSRAVALLFFSLYRKIQNSCRQGISLLFWWYQKKGIYPAFSCWSVLTAAQQFLIASLFFCSITAVGQPVLGMGSHFSRMENHPAWLVLLRDRNTGITVPWVHYFRYRDSAWVIFPPGQDWQIVASTLQFATSAKTIPNFCQLEGRVFSGKSLQLWLSGEMGVLWSNWRCRTREQ